MGESERTKIDRRAFMAGVVATALAAAACSSEDDAAQSEDTGQPAEDSNTTGDSRPALPTDLAAEVFALGVASGDPLPDSVILWTRIVADPLADDGGVGTAPIPVSWEVAADKEFADVVASGDAVAVPLLAHSVHADASALEPDTWYWYRFSVGDRISPVGRTRTTPAKRSSPEKLRFAFASCQNRQAGYWTAHKHLAEENIDLVLFLGDYIYEEAPGAPGPNANRSPAPVDLPTYRARWADYKTDPALQAAHARCPWVCTWDDHEVSNDYADDVAQFADPADQEGRARFLDRRAAAYQAFYEHSPVRLDPPEGPDYTIYRHVLWGKLAGFYVLDGRQYRSDQACADSAILAGTSAGPLCDEAKAEDRTMLGEEQEAWLGDAFEASDARWNVLANQTVMTTVPFASGIYNLDQWDGYPAARDRLLEQLVDVSNPIVITGDIHLSGVGTIGQQPDDSDAPVAVEFVGTSISSPFPAADLIESTVSSVPEVHYINARQRGYVVCTVTPEETRAEFRFVSTIADPEATVETGATWIVTDGDAVPRSA
ncbi:MAG TPA: alkaline phosphatase D family protein [Acidimicrobiales bacterium]|jgi:alkaline phosphatase D